MTDRGSSQDTKKLRRKNLSAWGGGPTVHPGCVSQIDCGTGARSGLSGEQPDNAGEVRSADATVLIAVGEAAVQPDVVVEDRARSGRGVGSVEDEIAVGIAGKLRWCCGR
jgi:hypothetical protein